MVWMPRRTVISSLAIAATGAAVTRLGSKISNPVPASLANRLPVGMNLAGIADWETGFPFRNLMWGARPWLTRNADCCGPWDTKAIHFFEWDENGYPLEAPIEVAGMAHAQVPFTLLPNVLRPGLYVLLHDGVGSIEGVVGTKVLKSEPGRVLLRMTHQADLVEGVVITRSVRGDHIRNVRILPLADEAADLEHNPFLTEFLEFCRPFHCLRFMDWACTNGSLEESWAQRRKPSFYTMVGVSGDPHTLSDQGSAPFLRRFSGGVAYELMLKLANLLEASPWICIPHRATDEYIGEMAKIFRDSLDPRLKVYLEYSNELWNFGFIQSQWMLSSRLAGDLLEQQGISAWSDKFKTQGTNHPERIGALFSRAFTLWMREWKQASQHRVARVCTVQHAWAEAAHRTATWCAKNGGADALAPAGYFGPGDTEFQNWRKKGPSLTASDVIADMRTVLERDTAKWTRAQSQIARAQGWDFLVYEGGQHIVSEGQADTAYNAALSAAQRHPGMYDLYIRNLELQIEAGCKLFCAYSSIGRQGTRFGSWGVKETYDEPTSSSPKLRALLDRNSERYASGSTK